MALGGNFFLEKVSLLFCVVKDLYKQDQVYVFATFMQIGQNPRWRLPCVRPWDDFSENALKSVFVVSDLVAN